MRTNTLVYYLTELDTDGATLEDVNEWGRERNLKVTWTDVHEREFQRDYGL